MRFPASQRFTYEKNPLVEVICQLRFPRILKIDNEDPYNFQEAIRSEYPQLYSKREIPISTLLADASPEALGAGAGLIESSKSHEFLDAKNEWKLVLASNFLSLSTLKYTTWEDFRKRLSAALDVLIRLYSPPHLSRIGLRYQDLIVKSEMGLSEAKWQELIQPSILGVLAIADVPDSDISEMDLTESSSSFGCTLDILNAKINVRSGLGLRAGSSEPGFLIDSDCYTDSPVEVSNVLPTLNQFNAESRNFFNWAIKPKLHAALSPIPIGTCED
jgi:uncharacterized protein (TIGR04255 family)